MGAITAVVDKEEQDMTNAILTMIKELAHRGKAEATYGIATAKEQTLANSIDELRTEKLRSNIGLGYIFSKTLPTDTPCLIKTDNFTFAFEGRTYPPVNINKKLQSNPAKTAKEIIKKCEGAYVFAIATLDALIVGRDALGLAPFYFAKNKSCIAFASERKALWKLGLKTTESFPPGNIATIKKHLGFSFKPVKTVKQPKVKPFEMKRAATRLQRLLFQSVKARVSDVKEVAVAFSGGLDSGTVAFLAKKCRVNVELITVSLENMLETSHAEEAAKALALPIHKRTISVDDVEKTLPKVLWLIEDPSPVQASIALPLFWTAEHAKKHGFNVLLAGQGADELFGGYHRYLGVYAERGPEELQKTLFRDVVRCYETNFQRDNHTCVFHRVELRLPFADFRIVNFALSLPLALKIDSSTDMLRKRVLRQAAANMRVPKLIVYKAKKAVQYTTGIDKALQTLAKRENLNTA
ncbi:MAG: asparagine synthase-related protein, partial [Candidatus Bathyarchaeia archaeon]